MCVQTQPWRNRYTDRYNIVIHMLTDNTEYGRSSFQADTVKVTTPLNQQLPSLWDINVYV